MVSASLAAFPAQAESRVAVINPQKNFTVEFQKMGLGADLFSREQLISMAPRTKVVLMESIDDSMLIVFSEQTPAEVFDAVFRDPAVADAVTRLLRRGGAIYFGPTNRDIINHLPDSMRQFFKAHHAYLPRPDHYMATSQFPKPVFRGYANPKFADHPLLVAPNRLSRDQWPDGAHAVNYWAGFPDFVMPLLVEPDKPGRAVVLMQQNVADKGRILFSLSYSLTRRGQSPFFQNLVKLLYGEIKPDAASRRRSAESASKPLADAAKKDQVLHIVRADAKAFTLDGKLDDPVWRQAKPVLLTHKIPTGDLPKKTTQAWLAIAGHQLVLAFRAHEPNLDGLKAEIRLRDGELWKNDAVDVVFNVGDLHKPDLRQWIVSASGAIFDAMQGNREWTSGVNTATGREADAWTVEISIPLKDLFDGDKAPKTFFANFARHDPQNGEAASWIQTNQIPNPVTLGVVTTLTADGFRQSLDEEARKVAAGDERRGIVIWSVPPGTQNLGPDTYPENDQATLEALSLHAPGRGHDSGVILITNFDDASATFRINHPRFLPGPNGSSVPFEDVFTLYQAVPRLNSYQNVTFDPLVEVGPARIVTVPGRETAMIWVDARAPEGKEKYEVRLGLLPITTLPKSITKKQWLGLGAKTPPAEKSVQLSFDVASATLADPLNVNSYTWGPYNHTPCAQGLEAAYADFARRFNITYVMASYPLNAIDNGPTVSNNPTDYIDARTLAGKDRIFFSYDLLLDFDRTIRTCGFTGETFDARWKELFEAWMANWIKALADKGISTERFYIQVLEEPNHARFPLAVKQAAFLKEKYPKVRIAMDVAAWNTQEELDALAPYMDLWIPHERRLTGRNTGPSELAFYKKQGNFWTYLCSVRADVQPLLAYYRYRGIRNWLLGSDGIALFAFNGWRGDAWAQWDVIPADGDAFYDECLIYNATNGPVPSLRLMEFRQGIEDFALLEMLRAKLHLKTRESLLRQLRGSPLDPKPILQSTQPTDIRQWRGKLLKTLGE